MALIPVIALLGSDSRHWMRVYRALQRRGGAVAYLCPCDSGAQQVSGYHCGGVVRLHCATLDLYTVYRSMVPRNCVRVQELCESRGGRPGLSVLTSLMVSVDVKQY